MLRLAVVRNVSAHRSSAIDHVMPRLRVTSSRRVRVVNLVNVRNARGAHQLVS